MTGVVVGPPAASREKRSPPPGAGRHSPARACNPAFIPASPVN